MLHSLSFSYFSTQIPLTVSETVPPSLSVSLPTHASTVSLSVPLAETKDPPASKLVRDFKYVYTHRPKILAFEPIPTIPSPVDGPLLHHQLLPLILIFLLPFNKVH